MSQAVQNLERVALPRDATIPMVYHVIRARRVCELLGGISKSHLYSLVRAGQLAPPVRLSRRWSAWRSNDVAGFIAKFDSSGTSTEKPRPTAQRLKGIAISERSLTSRASYSGFTS